jgi:hypothetical protein
MDLESHDIGEERNTYYACFMSEYTLKDELQCLPLHKL